jgi:hypothetical protein
MSDATRLLDLLIRSRRDGFEIRATDRAPAAWRDASNRMKHDSLATVV